MNRIRNQTVKKVRNLWQISEVINTESGLLNSFQDKIPKKSEFNSKHQYVRKVSSEE